MKRLTELILESLTHQKYTKAALIEELGIQTKEMNTALKILEEEGKIYIDKNGVIKEFPSNLIFGQIKATNNKYYMNYNGIRYQIEFRYDSGLLNRDTIIAKPTGKLDNGRPVATLEKIVKRYDGIVICEVQEIEGEKSLIDIYNDPPCIIKISNNALKKYNHRDRLKVQIGIRPTHNVYEGKVLEYLGNKKNPQIEHKSFLAKFNLKTGFSDESIEEAKKACITEKELQGRLDLTSYPTITIDSPTNKVRDDSFFITRLQNGQIILHINIVDITPWVKPGTALWKDAKEKSESVYTADNVEPLLPPQLLSRVGSLDEGKTRLAQTLMVQFDENYNIVGFDLKPSIIKTKKNCTYDDVNKILETGITPPGYEDLKDDIITIQNIASKYMKELERNGYIAFPIQQDEYIENELGEIVRIKKRKRGKSQDMVQAIMILANSMIPYFVQLPAPYRNNKAPSKEEMNIIIQELNNHGIHVNTNRNIEPTMQIKGILRQIKDKKTKDKAAYIILQHVTQSFYSPESQGHFIMGLDNYTKWTSPVRRFGDLLLHTIIQEQNELDFTKQQGIKLEEMVKMCEKLSNHDKLARIIENTSYQKRWEKGEDKRKNLTKIIITFISPKLIVIRDINGNYGQMPRKGFRYTPQTNSYKANGYTLHVGTITKGRLKMTIKGIPIYVIPKEEEEKLRLTRR